MKAVPKEFQKFAKTTEKKPNVSSGLNCVIYTRVSTKEQADNNLSLQTQLKACVQYAEKQNYCVLSYFGGTYESAKNDERKEFNRMLNFVRKSKDKVSHIIVYSVDRFSRSGANAVYIASELKKEGITVFAVTQPADSNTASGSLQQNIQFIFSEFENQQRKEKCMAGTREKLLSGHWSTKAPIGYDNVKINGDKKIVINEKGKLIKKAFEWKANEGLSNMEIIARLKEKGLILQKQMLTKILRNPFYCGLLSHKMLEGEVIEGKHERLISRELFLKVNQIQLINSHGWKSSEENENLPLKRFMFCEQCGKPMRGYIVQKKKIHYYKCGTTGCCVNENAKRLNNQFFQMLKQFEFDEKLLDQIKLQLEAAIIVHLEERINALHGTQTDLAEVHKKIERLEERYINEEINKELYQKYLAKFNEEKNHFETILEEGNKYSSNLHQDIENSLKFTMNIADLWMKSTYSSKQRIQQLVYPEGISYDKKIKGCRTGRVNEVLKLITSITTNIDKKKEGTQVNNVDESPVVDWRVKFSTRFVENLRYLEAFNS